MYTQAHKRIVSVTLDIECYEDLEIKDIDWSDVLDLQGDETVDVTIKEMSEVYWCDTFRTVHRDFRILILMLFHGRMSDDVLSSTAVPPASSDFL